MLRWRGSPTMLHVIPLWLLSSFDMRALELHRLSRMDESSGDRTLRVAERVTFWLVGGEKLVF